MPVAVEPCADGREMGAFAIVEYRLAADLVVATLADVRFTAEAGGVRLSRP